MSETVIKVENLSKKYIISHQGSRERYTALRDVMARGVKNLGKKILSPLTLPPSQDSLNATHEEFYALRDVSFEIKQGDRVGIIGRNGAGKSTLLKILSRITEPTSGRIEITGRVASLLEVGTGFHPELTGRENVFLNGAIMGMTREEIKRKFDEIVAFAEVEKFLDTPVKRYSSGMYVRLAFAVAAHLEPEILVVDEVLAVGDAQFQKKCLGKMKEVGKEGRTVLFVSHNMTAISGLCTICILLTQGKISSLGETKAQINKYLGNVENINSDSMIWEATSNSQSFQDTVKINWYKITDNNNMIANNQIIASGKYSININADIYKSNPDIRIGFAIYSEGNNLLLTSSANDSGKIDFSDHKAGNYILNAEFPVHLLSHGNCYYVEILCLIERVGWILSTDNDSKLRFTVLRDRSNNPNYIHRLGGVNSPISFEIDWNSNLIDTYNGE